MSQRPLRRSAAGPVIRLVTLLGVMTCAYDAESGEPNTSSDAFQLVWADEFDREGPPSPENWGFEQGFLRNQEAQWYQPDNATCHGGLLIIEARRERVDVDPGVVQSRKLQAWAAARTHADYTSASLTTRGKHQWLYGRFVMRARAPTAQGAWPAFWTVGNGPWPACGEIDIMECYRGAVLANFVWLGRGGSAKWDAVKTSIDELGADWGESFHEWRMDWDEDVIELSVDDRLLNSVRLESTINSNPTGDNPFRRPQYLLMNLAIGGENGGDPSQTPFPLRFEVDYVRVYQKRPPE